MQEKGDACSYSSAKWDCHITPFVKYRCCNEPEIMLFLVSPRNKVTEAASEVADTYPSGFEIVKFY